MTISSNQTAPAVPIPVASRLQSLARRGVVPTAGAPMLRRPALAQPPEDEQQESSGQAGHDFLDPFLDPGPSDEGTPAGVDHQEPVEAPQAPKPEAPVIRVAPRPGVFLKPVTARAPVLAPGQLATPLATAQKHTEAPLVPSLPVEMSAAAGSLAKQGVSNFYEQASQQASRQASSRQGMKEMASMRALSRLLEAVYQRPGGDAPIQERISALQELVSEAGSVAQEMARAFGYEEGTASQYVMAQAMESVVSLVSKAWERDESVAWAEMISQAGADPVIVGTAEAMAHAIYQPVLPGEAGKQIAHERLAISLHNAYWEVYLLGDQCDGITPEVASRVVRAIADHVQAQIKFQDMDLRVSWLQGSIKRMTGLFCAQMRSLDAAPSEKDVDRAVQLAKEGFEGVEYHASQLLEMCRFGASVPQPVDAPVRPGGG